MSKKFLKSIICMVVMMSMMLGTMLTGYTAAPILNGNDDFTDLSKIYEKSKNLIQFPTKPEHKSLFYDDFTMLLRTDVTEEWFTYKVIPSNKVRMTAYFWQDEPVIQFQFLTSKDNKKWTIVKPTIKEDSKAGKWLRFRYEIAKLPTGTNYVKVVFKNNSGNGWTPQIGQFSSTKK